VVQKESSDPFTDGTHGLLNRRPLFFAGSLSAARGGFPEVSIFWQSYDGAKLAADQRRESADIESGRLGWTQVTIASRMRLNEHMVLNLPEGQLE